MRSGGINWLAVVVAAIVIYAIGFVIYGMLIPEDRLMAMTGMSDAEKATAMTRMMYSPLMPVLTAVFMAVLFKWGAVADAIAGVIKVVLKQGTRGGALNVGTDSPRVSRSKADCRTGATDAPDAGRNVGLLGVSPEGQGSEHPAKNPVNFVPRDGIEPPTRGFSIPCSTN